MKYGRSFANATVLPPGFVVVNGGSTHVDDAGNAAVLQTEIWNPGSGQWTAAASAAIYRGYHSTAILMQNGALLTAGGGSPGPVANQNAEIYYPPYLFTSANGAAALAPRPQIVSLASLQMAYGQSTQFELTSQNGCRRWCWWASASSRTISTRRSAATSRILAIRQRGDGADAVLGQRRPAGLLPARRRGFEGRALAGDHRGGRQHRRRPGAGDDLRRLRAGQEAAAPAGRAAAGPAARAAAAPAPEAPERAGPAAGPPAS